jgi:hypothetical protein
LQLQSRKDKSPEPTCLEEQQIKTLSCEPGIAWLQHGARQYHRQLLGERLDDLVREADGLGLTQHETVRAVMEWAAERSFAAGGYPRARSLMLEALEAVLLADVTKKNSA